MRGAVNPKARTWKFQYRIFPFYETFWIEDVYLHLEPLKRTSKLSKLI